jgi:hypothetical protein
VHVLPRTRVRGSILALPCHILPAHAQLLMLARAALRKACLLAVVLAAQPGVQVEESSTASPNERPAAAGRGSSARPAACKIEQWERREIKSCSRLFLHYAQLGDDGATELAEALRGSQVTSLSLFGCGIGDRGAIALAAAMEQIDSPLRLEILNLGGNRIGDAGAEALGHALQFYAALTELNLADNSAITDVGVKAIAVGLDPAYTECALKTLNLWGVGKLTRSGVVALTEACETHQSLVTVILQPAEGIDLDLEERMQKALGQNKKMQKYGLDAAKTPVTMSHQQSTTMKTNLMAKSKRDEL